MVGIHIANLPYRTPIKLTISVLPDLNYARADYENIYAKAYGQTDPVIALIPEMLQTFLDSDREFRRMRAKRQIGNI